MGAGLTRAAVIGKIHRLGLTSKDGGSEYRHPTGLRTRSAASIAEKANQRRNGRTTQAINRINRAAAARAVIALKAKPKPQPKPQDEFAPAFPMAAKLADFDQIIPFAQRKTILELTDATCRWPIGDPAQAGFFFCGGGTIAGFSYCAYHCRVAYTPGTARKHY